MVTATRLIKVIILKYTETANHYFVYQDLTSYCRSIILQKSKKQNKTHRKGVRFVATINGSGEVELDKGSLKL